ncbi:MAG: hypothetical protein LUC98_12455 [Lachnospiraceae bacterium]|nr:hypothetical protein [Lachnospiraceae bacterium]
MKHWGNFLIDEKGYPAIDIVNDDKSVMPVIELISFDPEDGLINTCVDSGRPGQGLPPFRYEIKGLENLVTSSSSNIANREAVRCAIEDALWDNRVMDDNLDAGFMEEIPVVREWIDACFKALLKSRGGMVFMRQDADFYTKRINSIKSAYNATFYAENTTLEPAQGEGQKALKVVLTDSAPFEAMLHYKKIKPEKRVCILQPDSKAFQEPLYERTPYKYYRDLDTCDLKYGLVGALLREEEKVCPDCGEKIHFKIRDGKMNDNCIYYSQIPVILDKDGILIAEDDWVRFDVLTAAAPRLHEEKNSLEEFCVKGQRLIASRFPGMFCWHAFHLMSSYKNGLGDASVRYEAVSCTEQELTALLAKRFRRILDIARSRGDDAVILDNFGVSNGVAPEICADALHDALSGGDYDTSFDMIICAVGKGVERETGAPPYEVYKHHLRLPLFDSRKMIKKTSRRERTERGGERVI